MKKSRKKVNYGWIYKDIPLVKRAKQGHGSDWREKKGA
jgi:hypothetical protein